MQTFFMQTSKSLLMGLAVACVLAAATASAASAQAAKCEPDKLAQKYPGLVGKTLRIGQDGESPPYSVRDPKDFNHLIGMDADLARATFECIGVPIEFKTGAWS